MERCERLLDGGRSCYAASRRDAAGTFACQCYTQFEDGPEEDVSDLDVEATDCDAALERCVELDSMR